MDTWTTKDGREIKITDMATSHIKNTIAMLQRKISDSKEFAGALGEEQYQRAGELLKYIIAFEEEIQRRESVTNFIHDCMDKGTL